MTDPANPQPGETPGLQPGGGVDPGDTPPTSSQASGAGGPSGSEVPDAASRTGIILVLILVGITVAFFLAYFLARANDLF